MPVLGISRVTDVTRMDRLGLPVFVSVRPRGLALCVNAGKGLRATEARVGALMEALEYAVAEPAFTPWRRGTWRIDELERRWGDQLRMLDLAPRISMRIPSERLVDVVECEDVSTGDSIWLPAELIFVPFECRHGPPLFGWSTNGLASGNSVEEATLHALLEVLERDALAMNKVHDASRWVDHDELPEPFRTLAADWDRAGIALSVRQVPNDFALPCFHAVLHEGENARVDLMEGSGLHLDPGIALARAICEAAQSRLSHIHGGRDDITYFYAKHASTGRPAPDPRSTLAYRRAFDRSARIAWRDVPSMPWGAASLEDTLDQLAARLRGLGFGRILRHRFAADLDGLQVVKIVVPTCQFIEKTLARAGQRLVDRVVAHA